LVDVFIGHRPSPVVSEKQGPAAAANVGRNGGVWVLLNTGREGGVVGGNAEATETRFHME